MQSGENQRLHRGMPMGDKFASSSRVLREIWLESMVGDLEFPVGQVLGITVVLPVAFDAVQNLSTVCKDSPLDKIHY